MADVSQALVAFFSSANTLAGTRVYPIRLPDGATLPALVYQWIGGEPDLTHSGPGPRSRALQLTGWAQTYGQAQALSDQVYNLIHGTHSMGAYPVQAIYLEDEPIDTQDPDVGLYGVAFTIMVVL